MLSRSCFPIALALSAVLLLCNPPDARAQARDRQARDAQSLRLLEAEAGGAENVSLHPATSVPRFVRLGGLPLSLSRLPSSTPQEKHERSLAFLREYAPLFGIGDPAAALTATDLRQDALGDTHVTYVQRYRGVPVFAGVLKTHFNRAGELAAVSGTVIPDILVDPTPSVSRDAAAGAALAIAIKGVEAVGVAVRNVRLYIYRTGLARGVVGQSYLAWEVEIGDGTAVRQLIYLNAHTGAMLDRIDGIQDALVRRVYNTEASFPGTPFWVEGAVFPPPAPRPTT